MSSMCSSWRRRSPSMAACSLGSKLAIFSAAENMGERGLWREKGVELYPKPPPRRRGVLGRWLSRHRRDDFGPGAREGAPIVATAAEGQHPPVAEAAAHRGPGLRPP